jgi:hypothetical protein
MRKLIESVWESEHSCSTSSIPHDVQSLPLSTFFMGSTMPYENSMSPTLEVLTSLLEVENCPERTKSRLTALPAMMLLHSVSRNSGQSGELTRDLFVSFRSILKSRMRSRVLDGLADNAVLLNSPALTQGKSPSSTLGFLTLFASSSYLYPGSNSGEGAHRLLPDSFPLDAFPLPDANATSASWFSIIVIKDLKPASAFSLLIPSASNIAP